MNKTVTWLIVVILLAAGALWYRDHRQNTSGTTSTTTTQILGDWKTYNDPQGMFSFSHPPAFQVTGRELASSSPTGWSVFSQRPGVVLARVKVDRSYMPNTNFSEAWLTVGQSSDIQEIQGCTSVGTASSNVTIDGVNYKKFAMSDAAAGNRYDTTAYRAILGGDCYSLEYTVHYGNIQNYDPNQGITEFNESKIQSELDAVAKSFKFLVNSN